MPWDDPGELGRVGIYIWGEYLGEGMLCVTEFKSIAKETTETITWSVLHFQEGPSP